MKNKKILIYIICFALISSFIGIKLNTNKNKSSKNTVVIVDTEKTKPKIEVSNTKSTDHPKASDSSTTNTASSSETSKQDITMIDTTSNTEGNSSGNLANSGYFAKQGKWIYFTIPPASSKHHPIYRAMSDGETGLKAITEPGFFRCINIIGNWVYYINAKDNYIYRTKTDGSSTELVKNGSVINMYIKYGLIYYNDTNGIFKFKLDSPKDDRGNLLIEGSNFNFIYVSDNLIYTTCYNTNRSNGARGNGELGQQSLYSMNLDGSNFKSLNTDFTNKFIFYNNYIFYVNLDNQKLYRMDSNGSNKTQLISFPIANYNISNNNIYFNGAGVNDNNIYKSNLDGKSIIKLTNNNYSYSYSEVLNSNSTTIDSIYSISIIDDYIFYLGFEGTDANIYKCKIDGSINKPMD